MSDSATNPSTEPEEIDDREASRYRTLGPVWLGIISAMTSIAMLIAIDRMFALEVLQALIGKALVDNRYLYLVGGIMISMVFVVLPGFKRSS